MAVAHVAVRGDWGAASARLPVPPGERAGVVPARTKEVWLSCGAVAAHGGVGSPSGGFKPTTMLRARASGKPAAAAKPAAKAAAPPNRWKKGSR